MARNLSNAAASLLPYSTIEAAASGNVDAINAVLKHYERYIAALATRTLYDENGVPHLCLDEEKVCRMVKPPFGCAWCPLTNRRKTGCKAELFLKNPKNYFEGFSSGVSRISRVWGRHSPTRFPQGQNERKANFGTAVESCSP